MPYTGKRKRSPYVPKKQRRRVRQRTYVPSINPITNQRTGGYSGMEVKYFDTAKALANAACSANLSDGIFDPTTIDCLNCPETGSGPQNREGRMIKMRSVHIEGVCQFVPQFDNTVVATVPDVFIALVLDTQTNKAQMSSGDCFTNPSNNLDLVTAPFRDLEYTKRFKVLKIRRIRAPDLSLDITGASGHEYSGKLIHFEMHKKLFDLPVQFVGNASPNTVGNIQDNSLHVIVFCDCATSSADTTKIEVKVGYNARVRFCE